MGEFFSRIGLFTAGVMLACAVNVKPAQAVSNSESTMLKGDYTNVIVFVDFADSTHEHTGYYGTCYDMAAGKTIEIFDGDENHQRSLKNYISNISYGNVKVTNVFPQYDESSSSITQFTLSNNASYYLNKDETLITEVAAKLKQQGALSTNKTDSNGTVISTTSIDGNNDGFIDNLTIVIAGENSNGNDDYISHRSFFAGNTTLNSSTTRIGNYNILCESDVYFGIGESGVVIHEFMHTLGFPDLYRTRGSAQVAPVSLWDIMASESLYVQYPLAYMRATIGGWFDIATVTTNQRGYSLYSPISAGTNNKDKQAVILTTPYSDTEIFVIEYRQKQNSYQDTDAYDVKIPGSGLVVYRVDTTLNTNISGPPDMVYVFRSGETLDSEGKPLASRDTLMSGSYFSAESLDHFGGALANATICDGAITYSDGTNSGIVIGNVSSAANATISFDITFNSTATESAWKKTALSGNECNGLQAFTQVGDIIYYVADKQAGTTLMKLSNGSLSEYLLSESNATGAHLTSYKDSLFASYVRSDGKGEVVKITDKTSQVVFTTENYVNEISCEGNANGLYIVYTMPGTGNFSNVDIYAGIYTESQNGADKSVTNSYKNLGLIEHNSGYAANLVMVCDGNGFALTFREAFNNNINRLYYYDGSTFKKLGYSRDGASITGTGTALKAASVNGVRKLYLAYNGFADNSKESYVLEYSFVTETGFEYTKSYRIPTQGNYLDLYFDRSDEVYLARCDYHNNAIYVSELKNGTLSDVGSHVANGNLSKAYISRRGDKAYVLYYNSLTGAAEEKYYVVGNELSAEVSTLSGKCGDNATFTFDVANKTLSIYGSGAVYDYQYSTQAPWAKNKLSIEKLVIGSGITSIGTNCFYGCTNLVTVNGCAGLTNLGNNAFRNCRSLVRLAGCSKVEIVGQYTFAGDNSLVSIGANSDRVSLPATTKISGYSFYECKSIKNLYTYSPLTYIGTRAFSNCESLTTALIGIKCTTICSYAFCNTSLVSVTGASAVTGLGKFAFYENRKLKSIAGLSKLTNIGDSAFRNCTSLVTLGSMTGQATFVNVIEIGEYAFSGAQALKGFVAGGRLLRIKEYAFRNTFALAKFSTSSTKLTSSNGYVADNAFSGSKYKFSKK